MKIYPVIMCGGAGTRLWPVSDTACPKQFHRLLSDRSVFQETILRFANRDGEDAFGAPLIISNAAYAGIIREQLEEIAVDPAAILLEPVGRNTAAVAALAADYLAENFPGGLGLLAPSDHFIGRPEVFISAVRAAAPAARAGRITTFGISPSRPDTGFGYIQAGDVIEGMVRTITAFREKPDAETAASYLASGQYSWNAGIFLFEAGRMTSEFSEHAPEILDMSRRALASSRREGVNIFLDPDIFAGIPADSIDYAIMERTQHAAIYAPLDCAWSDVGTWSMIGEVSTRSNNPEPVIIDSGGCLVHAADGVLVAAVGVENLVIVADGKRVLVASRARSQDVGEVVRVLRQRGLPGYL